MLEFSLASRLGYRVKDPVPFVFNVQVLGFDGQVATNEKLTIRPDMPMRSWTVPDALTHKPEVGVNGPANAPTATARAVRGQDA